MKKTSFPLFAIASILLLFALSCSKNDSNEEIITNNGDTTPLKLIERFEEFEVIQLNDDEVVAANGLTITQIETYLTNKYGTGRSLNQSIPLTPNDQLLQLKTQLVKFQKELTVDTNYSFENQINGLAYCDAGKTDLEKIEPSARSVCKEKLYGLDCSGMIYLGAKRSNLNIAEGNVDTQSDIQKWNEWLANSIYKDVTVSLEEMTFWNDSDWNEGDIIVFNRGTENRHIGTLVRKQNNDKLAIIHSQGSYKKTCDQNKGPKLGPKMMSSDNDPGNWNFFTTEGEDNVKTIHRLRFEIKDAYNLKLRCFGASSFAYTANLKIDTTSNETYEDEAIFLDYDGSTINQKFNYSYNTASETFTFNSVITDSELENSTRIDSFTITLAQLGMPILSIPTFTGAFSGCNAEFILSEGYSAGSPSSRISNQNPKGNRCALTEKK